MRLWNWFLSLFTRKNPSLLLRHPILTSELDIALLYKTECQKVEEEEKLQLAKEKAEAEERDRAKRLAIEEGLKHITSENYRLAWQFLAEMAARHQNGIVQITAENVGITNENSWFPFSERFRKLCSERGIQVVDGYPVSWICVDAKSFIAYIKRIENASVNPTSDNKTINTSAYR
jgi:hypothetical protein